MHFSFVSVIPKYLKYVIFSNNLLFVTILMRFCHAFCERTWTCATIVNNHF